MTPDLFGLNLVYENASGERGVDPRTLTQACQIDDAALAGYLTLSHVPTPTTIFADVRRVSALTPSPNNGERSSIIEGQGVIHDSLRAAVRSRLTDASRPVGVFLSGGLDSSVVAALLVESRANVIAFTLDFGPDANGETEWAEAVAAHLEIPIRKIACGSREVAGAWEATARALPQPFGDAVCVPLFLLGQAAKNEVSEVWNGEGGDQLFGGWANKPLVVAQAFGATDLRAAYLDTYHRFHGSLDALWPTHPTISPESWIAPGLDALPDAPLLHRLRMANVLLKGAQNIAPRCVALGAAHGLKVVAPLFDEALLEATFALPPEAFLVGACEKAVFKHAARGLLPDEIVFREKRGMGVPSAEWLFERQVLRRPGPVARKLRSALSTRNLKREDRFDPAFVGTLLSGIDNSPAGFRRRRVAEKLWCLGMWEVWREVHSL